MNLRYLHFDLMRVLRNKRVLIFTIVTPLLLFAIFGSAQGDYTIGGISATAYVMVSMARFDDGRLEQRRHDRRRTR